MLAGTPGLPPRAPRLASALDAPTARGRRLAEHAEGAAEIHLQFGKF